MLTSHHSSPIRSATTRHPLARPLKLSALLVVAALSMGFTTLERLGIPSAKLADAHWKQSGSATFNLNAPYQKLLDRYVSTDRNGINRVAYGKVTKADKKSLDAYITSLSNTKVTSGTKKEQLAYWVNLYNAKTLSIVLDKYPVKSIRDIKFSTFSAGPWGEKLLKVEGRSLSLNDIEHKIVRPLYRDRRVHYVLNCAAIGCPNLGKKAYSGGTIIGAMDKAARVYVNHPRGASVSAKGKLKVSKIYGWFIEDFGGKSKSIIAELKKYAKPGLAKKLQNVRDIDDYSYDWALNDQRSAPGA